MPADPTTVSLGADAATVIKDTVVAVWTAVGPMGVGALLAFKALPWAAKIVGVGGASSGGKGKREALYTPEDRRMQREMKRDGFVADRSGWK